MVYKKKLLPVMLTYAPHPIGLKSDILIRFKRDERQAGFLVQLAMQMGRRLD